MPLIPLPKLEGDSEEDSHCKKPPSSISLLRVENKPYSKGNALHPENIHVFSLGMVGDQAHVPQIICSLIHQAFVEQLPNMGLVSGEIQMNETSSLSSWTSHCGRSGKQANCVVSAK